AQIDRPILVVRASFDQGYRITLQAFRVFPVAKSFPKLFLAKLWQSEKIVLCSLAVRRATRINNPRVISISITLLYLSGVQQRCRSAGLALPDIGIHGADVGSLLGFV